MPADDFIEFVDAAETGQAQVGWFEGKGPLAIIALVLFGGLALNLTPCVLPMIPINLGIIGAGANAGSRAQGFALGGVYGLAMALVYGVLGLVVVLTAGTFGTINSTAWFNIAIAVLFVFLALAMFDIITIDFSSLQSKVKFSEGSGKFALAFGMGAVAALLAGACVAPVVIQVVIFSSDLYAKGQMLALGLPFLLGLGMAIPWPIAGAGISALPRPGAWMVRVKQAFGVLILGFAAYYAYLGYEIVSSRWVDGAAVADSVSAKIEEGWVPSLDAGLQMAKAENKMCARRHLGNVVQELPHDGQDDVRGRSGQSAPRRLREDQVPGRGSGSLSRPGGDQTLRRRRASRVRDFEAPLSQALSFTSFLDGGRSQPVRSTLAVSV